MVRIKAQLITKNIFQSFVLSLTFLVGAMERNIETSIVYNSPALKTILEQSGTFKNMLEDCKDSQEISLPQSMNGHAFNNLYALMGTTLHSDEKERSTIFSHILTSFSNEELVDVIIAADCLEASSVAKECVSFWMKRCIEQSEINNWLYKKKYNFFEPNSLKEKAIINSALIVVNEYFSKPNTITKASLKQLLIMRYILQHKKDDTKNLPCPYHELKEKLYRDSLNKLEKQYQPYFITNYCNWCDFEDLFGDSGY